QDRGITNKAELGLQLILVERGRSKEVEIERLPVTELQGNCGAAIEDEAQFHGGCKLRPDFALRRRQDGCFRSNPLPHRASFAGHCPESLPRWQMTIGRAKTPRSDRRSSRARPATWPRPGATGRQPAPVAGCHHRYQGSSFG